MNKTYSCSPIVVSKGQKKLPASAAIEAIDMKQAALQACQEYGWLVVQVVMKRTQEGHEGDNDHPRMDKRKQYDYRGVRVAWDGSWYSPIDSKKAAY